MTSSPEGLLRAGLRRGDLPLAGQDVAQPLERHRDPSAVAELAPLGQVLGAQRPGRPQIPLLGGDRTD